MDKKATWDFLRNTTYNFYEDFYYGKMKYSGLVFILPFGEGKTRNITHITKEWYMTNKFISTFLYTAPTHKLINQTINDLSENDPHFAGFHRHIWGIEKLCENVDCKKLFQYFPNHPTSICRKYCHLRTSCEEYHIHRQQWENEDYPTFLPHNYLQNYIPQYLKKSKFSSLLVDENCKEGLKTVIRTSLIGYLKLGKFLGQIEDLPEKDFLLESYKAILKNQPFKLSSLIEDFSFVRKRINEFNDCIDEVKLEIIKEETSEIVYKSIPNIPDPIFDLGIKLKKLSFKDRLNKLDTYMMDNSRLRFYLYVDIPSTCPIILLDSYNRRNEQYFLNHNFKIYDLENNILLPKLIVYQDRKGNYPRSSLYHPQTFNRKIQEVKQILDKFKGEDTLIICCKGDEKGEDHKIEYKVKKALEDYPNVMVEHYGYVSGMNEYKDFTICILFGDYRLSNDEVERMSKEENKTSDDIKKEYEEFKKSEAIGRLRIKQRSDQPIKLFIFIRDFPVRSYYNIPDKNYFCFGGNGYPSLFTRLNPNANKEFLKRRKMKRKIKKILRENDSRMFLSDLKSSLPYDNNLIYNLLTELEGKEIIQLIKENRKTVGRPKKIVELLI